MKRISLKDAADLSAIFEKTRSLLEGIQAGGITAIPVAGLSGKRSTKADHLEPIRRQALACQACRLSKGRHSVVFGEGPLNAKLLFVGEGPGREEDIQGRPFVGAAGELLTKIIQAMGLTRDSVYITNVVKCRPPMNRPPQPDEIEACHGYLTAQLETIAPRVICALGKTAATVLLRLEIPMNKMRGKTFEWHGIPLVVTFHPAYLLRNPSAKPLVWQDMQRVLALLRS